MNNREIDALVAEAMGAEVTPAKKVHLTDERIEYHSAKMEWHSTRLDYIGELPHYSTDWSAAAQIVQAMRCGHAGHAAAVIEMIVFDHIPPNDCYCHIYGPDLAGGEAYANEMPMAICLAFLRAMGVEVPTPATSPE